MQTPRSEQPGLLGLIASHQDLGHYQELLWEGGYGDYLELVREDPRIARNAYQRLYDLLARDVAAPDLVVYLQAPTDVLLRRMKDRFREDTEPGMAEPDASYLRELNEAYQHFFFHYTATPLLVVETAQVDLRGSDDAVDDLVRQIEGMTLGTRYYVPRG